MEKKDIDIIEIITETNALIDLLQTKETIRERIPSCRIYANGYTRKQIEDKYEEEEMERIRRLPITQQAKEFANLTGKMPDRMVEYGLYCMRD